jgi:F-type H+-transporting ATPase subunit epsilon
MKLEIITPDKELFSGDAKALVLPGIDGELGVLENHAPLVTTLKKGKIKVTDSTNKEQFFEVNGGVFEVANNKATILAE